LVANCLELGLFVAFRYVFIWENKKKDRVVAEMIANGQTVPREVDTAFSDLTDKENLKWVDRVVARRLKWQARYDPY
jgi:hypothetical protein